MESRAITIEDVAREAGVSRQTVSRAINGKGEISAPTRQRVLAVAKRLGYRPSRIARSLATRTSGTVGLIVPDIANPFFPEIAHGAAETAYALGYQIFLSNTAEDPDREWAIIQALEEHWVAGLIMCSSRLSDEQLAQTSSRQPSLLLFNRQLPDAGVASLLVDDFGGATAAIQYLLESGHREIGILLGPARSWSGKRRHAAFDETLRAAGIEPREELIAAGRPDVGGGRAAMSQLLAQAPSVTAVLAYNDLMALGAIQTCLEGGRLVPDDCAIIGCDDIPLAALVTPPLTTVQVDKGGAGRRAMEMLHRLIANPAEDHPVEYIPTRLAIRQSA